MKLQSELTRTHSMQSQHMVHKIAQPASHKQPCYDEPFTSLTSSRSLAQHAALLLMQSPDATSSQNDLCGGGSEYPTVSAQNYLHQIKQLTTSNVLSNSNTNLLQS